MPTGGDWRNAADYDYFDDLAPGQIAFEFLRRSRDYVVAYRQLQHAPAATSAPAEFVSRWGLRFRRRSFAPR